MVKVPSAAEVAARYKAGAARAPANYQAGVAKVSDQEHKSASIAAQGLYEERMRDQQVLQSRVTGLEKGKSWSKGASTKGAANIGRAMADAAPLYQQNIQGVLDVIGGTSLPARVADSDANIDNRLKPLARNLQAWKRSRR